MSERAEQIRQTLTAALAPSTLDIVDESHLHAGHAGARDGKGHFAVRIVSSAFYGLSPIKRHQLVYKTLASMLETDIHALSIKALTEAEADPV